MPVSPEMSRDPAVWQDRLRRAAPEAKDEVFEAALKVWPGSTELWLEYAAHAAATGSKDAEGKLLARALRSSLDTRLYTQYIEHVRAASPEALGSAFDFALARVSFDPQSGSLWRSYIDWLEVQPAANEWEEQFKRDRVRKAYKRAVTLPLTNIEQLWRAYGAFETRIGRVTARRFIDERSAAYMRARTALRAWTPLAATLSTGTLPTEADALRTASAWRKLGAWEAGNPLELGADELKARVESCYRRAVLSARWAPAVWFDAGIRMGYNTEFWASGLRAMPESSLLAYKLAETHEAQGSVAAMQAVLRGLAAELASLDEDATPAWAELVAATRRLAGVEASFKELDKALGAVPEPGWMLYVEAARNEQGRTNARTHSAPHEPASETGDATGSNTKDAMSDVETKIWLYAQSKFARTSSDFALLYIERLFDSGAVVSARAAFEESADLAWRNVWDTMLRLERAFAASAHTSITALRDLERRYVEKFEADELQLFAQRFAHAGLVVESQEKTSTGHITALLAALPLRDAYDGPNINVPLLIQLIESA